VTWRAGTATVALTLVIVGAALLRGRPIVPPGVPRREAVTLLAAAGAGVVLNLALFVAFDRVTVALALFGFYTYPVMVALAGVLLLGDRLDARRLAALALAMGGMTLVVLGQIGASEGAFVDPLGVVLALVAAGCQAFFVLVTRHGFRSIPSEHASWTALGVGCAAFIAIALGSGSADDLALPLRAPDVLALVLFAGIVAAGVATSLFIVGVRLVGPLRAGILSLFEPVVGVVLAAVVLAEALTAVELIGGALVLGAAVLLHRGGELPETPPGVESVPSPTTGSPS
jgi:drug/metabolite transporter (DMT)-like permease